MVILEEEEEEEKMGMGKQVVGGCEKGESRGGGRGEILTPSIPCEGLGPRGCHCLQDSPSGKHPIWQALSVVATCVKAIVPTLANSL